MCSCQQRHRVARSLVLTGGPGAGKTAVLELARRIFCRHVVMLPEAAGIVFGGGFPRSEALAVRQASQRAIYFVQRELEACADDNAAVVVCDRGTVDGEAYWPGPGHFWSELSSSRKAEWQRYETVIHLRTPAAGHGYSHSNPLRIETPVESAEIDARIAAAWAGHPGLVTISASDDFMAKAHAALRVIARHVPPCCATVVPDAG